MKNITAIAAFLAAVLFVPSASSAAGKDELWEVKQEMEGMPDMGEMPAGMPAGMMKSMGAMGGGVQQVCRSSDPEDEVHKRKDMKDCKVTDRKASGTRLTIKMSCKGGRSAVMDYKFNSAHTQYTGTMKMDRGGGEEMTMKMTGRKIGSCDAQVARAERNAKMDKMKADVAGAQAQGEAAIRKAQDDQIAQCKKAVADMDPSGLGMFGRCRGKSDKGCKSYIDSMNQQNPAVAKVCAAKADEFCRGLKTIDGYAKVGANASHLGDATEMCGVDDADLRGSLCPKALKAQTYDFVGSYCPKEAKPLAKEHCAGRSYTVKLSDPRSPGAKWRNFCVALAGSSAMGDAEEVVEAPKSRGKRAKAEAESTASDVVKDQATEAGLNKLKGLFGR